MKGKKRRLKDITDTQGDAIENDPEKEKKRREMRYDSRPYVVPDVGNADVKKVHQGSQFRTEEKQ